MEKKQNAEELFEKSERIYLEQIKRQPLKAQNYLNRAQIYHLNENFLAGIDLLKNYVDLNPENTEVLYQLGSLLNITRNPAGP
jgi:tetratricopeptide (TPR) repeat protein